jgi:hypothetical protein
MEEQSIKVTDLDKRVQTLQERYPFNEQELEILETCHDHLKKGGGDDFLMKMAMSSPYTYYFLPGDELRNRVTWIEDHILPPGFVNELRAAISADAFVEYANQGEDKSLERFLEGVADTGRRGTREALRVLYNLLDEGEEPQPDELMDVCIRLAVASEAIATPNLDKIACLKKLEAFQPAVDAFADSLERALGGEPLTLRAFTDWAEETFPMLSTPLSTFVHRILFHGERYPEARVPFDFAKPENDSSIISDASSPLLLALSMTSEQFGGKVCFMVNCRMCFLNNFCASLTTSIFSWSHSGTVFILRLSTDARSIAWNGRSSDTQARLCFWSRRRRRQCSARSHPWRGRRREISTATLIASYSS